MLPGLVIALLFVTLLPALGQDGESGPRYEDLLARGGLSGWEGSMETMNLPAEVSRILLVPETEGQEAWGIGHVTQHGNPDWDSSPAGQIVFLRYLDEEWSVTGPPVNSEGAPINPNLTALAFASKDEGWAVGLNGTMLHYKRGENGDSWVQKGSCPADPCDLFAVSLRTGPSGAYGYAVGNQGLRLKLTTSPEGAQWTPDATPFLDPTDQQSTTSPPRLTAVAVISEEEVWAVGGSRHLKLFRRTGQTATDLWERRLTGNPLFDNSFPLAGDVGGITFGALGYTAGATPDGSAVWFGGGFQPLDPDPSQEQSETRPFTVAWRATEGEGTITTYCPAVYALDQQGSGAVETQSMCDQRMPMGPGIISSISVIPSEQEELFAAGLGLFHFKEGSWWREPDSAGYLASVSFFDSSEGWVAPGEGIGALVARSPSPLVGHFTSKAQSKPRVARWPQPNRTHLESVSLAPDGRAIAVGADSKAMLYQPGVGWDVIPPAIYFNSAEGVFAPERGYRQTSHLMHGVDWRNESEAWAVGQFGVMLKYDGATFTEDPASQDFGRPTTDPLPPHKPLPDPPQLFAVAFVSPDLGYAVGAAGTILVYQDGVWSKDPMSGVITTKTLYDLVAVGNSIAAVGQDSTFLLNLTGQPGQWGESDAIRVALGGRNSALYSIKAVTDGTILVGGANQTLLVRKPGINQPFRKAASAVKEFKTFLDVTGARGPNGELHIIASASPDSQKYFGDKLIVEKAALVHWDGTAWTTLDRPAAKRIHEKSDAPYEEEPAYSVEIESIHPRGWAVGGTPLNPSSSAYRFDLTGDPNPPDTTMPWHQLKSVLKVPDDAITFAFLAESRCGPDDESVPVQDCNIAVGTGNASDEVLLEIQRNVNSLVQEAPWGPKFVVYGGGMRLRGIPEELAELDGFFDGFESPTFGAIGARDLFSPATVSSKGLEQFLPGFLSNFLPEQRIQLAPVNDFFQRQFATMPKPWGTGRSAPEIEEFIDPGIGLRATEDLARTHYAFDYAPDGKRVVRIAVIDTSDRIYSVGKNLESQNPAGQDQSTWLTNVAQDATNRRIPLIVVSNVPSANPLTSANVPPSYDRSGVLTDWPAFESQVQAIGVRAVLSGFVRGNARFTIGQGPTAVPAYILGSAGAPPGGNQFPSNGHYHSWGLVVIDPDGDRDVLGQPRAKVTVHAIPVLESLALSARDGLEAIGGTALRFEGLGRAIAGGGPDDPKYGRRSYLSFPMIESFEYGVAPDGARINRLALRPDYHFVSENPEIADFVKPDLSGDNRPLLLEGIKGNVILDDQSGLLCTFKAGSTHIRIVSGNKYVRMPVSVTQGNGLCVKDPVPPEAEPPPPIEPEPEAPAARVFEQPRLPAEIPPQIPLPTEPAPVYRPWHQSVPNSLPVFIFPPAPGPVVAPAPPGSPAGAAGTKKEEEKEVSHESADQEFRAIPRAERRQSFDQTLGWMYAASAALLAFAAAMVAGTVTQARRKSMARPVRVSR